MLSEKGTTVVIKNLFPKLLTHPVRSVQPETETLEVIHALLRDRLDIILLQSAGGNSPKAVSGYSIISRLVQIENAHLEKFLSEPCVNSSLTLGTLAYETDDFQSLLHTFEVSSFGYALVRSTRNPEVAQLISIRDLLSLYQTGVLSSDLRVRDVASAPIASVERERKLLDTLSEMMQRKIRRMKISHTRWELVTDRDILEFVFQRARTSEYGTGQWIASQMIKPLSEMRLETAPWVEQNSNFEKASKIVLNTKICCALSQSGIITPSDLILKPWRFGRLSLHW